MERKAERKKNGRRMNEHFCKPYTYIHTDTATLWPTSPRRPSQWKSWPLLELGDTASLYIYLSVKMMQLSPPILSHFWKKVFACFVPNYIVLTVLTKYFIKQISFVSWVLPQFPVFYPHFEPLFHLKYITVNIESTLSTLVTVLGAMPVSLKRFFWQISAA